MLSTRHNRITAIGCIVLKKLFNGQQWSAEDLRRLEDAVEGGLRDPERLADGGDVGFPAGMQPFGECDLLGVNQLLRAAANPSAGTSRRQTGIGALLDQGPLELGQRPEDVEDQLAAGGGGVDRLGQRAKPDALRFQPVDGRDQVLERATQAIEPPDHDRVARTHIGEGGVDAGARGGGAGRDVGEDLATAGDGESVLLQIEGLVPGGDAGIANQHVGSVSQTRNGASSETLISRRVVIRKSICFGVTGTKV